jgi:hypothetical protein
LATHLSFLCHYYLQSLEATGSPGEFAADEMGLKTVADSLELSTSELENLYKTSNGLLKKLLCGELIFPDIHIHAGLNPSALRNAISKRASVLVRELAEMGLGKRPIHLWFGSDLPTYFLSPFIRELEPQLKNWAASNFNQFGPDLLSDSANLDNPNFLLGVALDFLNINPDLVKEMKAANEEIGIMHREFLGQPFEIIDCERLDYSGVDPRVRPPKTPGNAPVFLRLPHLLEDDRGELLRSLTRLTESRIKGVTIAMGGTHVGHPSGSVLLPDLALRWEGERKIAFPTRTPLMHTFPDNPGGVLLTGPCGPLLSGGQIQSLSNQLRIAGITLGFGGLLEAMTDCLWSGLISSRTRLHWPLVAQTTTASGRPDFAGLDGWGLVIETILRPILGMLPDHLTEKKPTKAEPSKKVKASGEKPNERKAKQNVEYAPPSNRRIKDLGGGPVLPPPGYEGNQPTPPHKPHDGRKVRIKA